MLRDTEGKTFLIRAVEGKLDEIAKFLLNQDENPQIRDNTGQTALHKATNSLNVNLVKLLIKAGFTIDISDNNSLASIWYTVINSIINPQAQTSAFQILELLKLGNFETPIPNKIQIGQTILASNDMIPFFFACTAKNSVYTNSGREIAKKLLDLKPINPDIKDSMG